VNKDSFNQLLAAMIGDGAGVSDLLFLPGRPAQLDHSGRLRPYAGDLIESLVTPELTRQLADILMEGNQLAGG
jgi:hypothetical protein